MSVKRDTEKKDSVRKKSGNNKSSISEGIDLVSEQGAIDADAVVSSSGSKSVNPGGRATLLVLHSVARQSLISHALDKMSHTSKEFGVVELTGAGNMGDRWRKLIHQIDLADCVVHIWDETTAPSSHPVSGIARYARSQGKLVTALEDSASLKSLPKSISAHILVGWSGDTNAPEWTNLVGSIRMVIDGGVEDKDVEGSGPPDPSSVPLIDLDEQVQIFTEATRWILDEAIAGLLQDEVGRTCIGTGHIIVGQLALGEQVLKGRKSQVTEFLSEYLRRENIGIEGIVSNYGAGLEISSEPGNAPPANANRSEYVTRTLADAIIRAGDFATRTIDHGVIHPRHLLAALLLDPNEYRNDAVDELVRLHVDVLDLQRELLSNIDKTPYPDDMDQWRQIFDGYWDTESPSVASRTLAGVHSDGVDGVDDLLDIAPDVKAFASLIASTDLKPPLSIGLFGDWGGGKSFFMKELRGEVNKLASETRTAIKSAESSSSSVESVSKFHPNVVQIEFNAWHYIDDNLWASLVCHIFDELDAQLDRDAGISRGEYDDALMMLDSAIEEKRIAEEKALKAEEDRERADADLLNKELDLRQMDEELITLSATDLIESLKADPEINQQFEELKEQLGLSTVEEAITEFQKAGAQVGILARLAEGIWKAPNCRGRFMGAAGAAIVAMGVVFGPEALGLSISGLKEWVFNILGTLVPAAAWIAANAKKISGWAKSAQTVGKSIEASLEVKERSLNERIRSERKKLDSARLETERAAEILEEKNRKVAIAQKAVEDTSPAKRIEKLIRSRAASQVYKNELGIISAIRKDFENLSEALVEADDGPTSSKELKPSKSINRIVLYIDDLDRCPPERVVDVLQAIHLILAFPLFVVVVGVDQRWVTHSLSHRYPDLLDQFEQSQEENMTGSARGGQRKAARPNDYLEKIFQIPFWLSQLTDDSADRFLDGLFEGRIESEGSPSGGKNGNRGPDGTSSGEGDDSEGDEIKKTLSDGNDDDTSGSDVAVDLNALEAERERQEQIEKERLRELLSPAALTFKAEEVNAIRSLRKVFATTPRAAKRFANIYQLAKSNRIAGSDVEFVSEDGKKGEYIGALCLLAVMNREYKLAQKLFSALKLEKSSKPAREFIDGLKVGMSNTRHNMCLDEISKYIRANDFDLTVGSLQEMAPYISRYTFSRRPLW